MVIFTMGGFMFYKFVRIIVIRQITNSLITEKKLIEEQILNSDSLPDFTTIFGHEIEVTLYDQPLRYVQVINDTLIADSSNNTSDHYRHLRVTGNFKDNRSFYRGYSINIFKSLADTHKLIMDLFLVIWLVLISLVLILITINLWISKKMWIPFYKILNNLSQYNINENLHLNLTPSGILEFDQLIRVLNSMSERIRSDFINLKEFTEDASHEIHTPLSIIKSKLELLFQSENLTEEQFQNIRTIYEAVSRLSRLNNSLLLISRIQNKQFPEVKEINLTYVIEKFLIHFKEVIQQKNISITKHYNDQTTVNMNPDLAEILISNLLGNAFKHNVQNGSVTISLNARELVITNTGHKLEADPGSLFKRFKKGNISSDSSGLGLSIINKIVSLYNFNVEYSAHDNLHSLTLRF